MTKIRKAFRALALATAVGAATLVTASCDGGTVFSDTTNQFCAAYGSLHPNCIELKCVDYHAQYYWAPGPCPFR
jgi:hypothetical protein